MEKIILFTKKYFYAKEITDFLVLSDIQTFTFWKEEEFFSELLSFNFSICMIDYESKSDVDWTTFFKRMSEIKKNKNIKIIGLIDPDSPKLFNELFDIFLEKPLALKKIEDAIKKLLVEKEFESKVKNELYEVEYLNKKIFELEQQNKYLESDNHYLKAYIFYMKHNYNLALRECKKALFYNPLHKKANKLIKKLKLV